MPASLNPYLTFQSEARKAMEFYRSVFGGELHISTFSEFGGEDNPNPDGVMHASLDNGSGVVIMASDAPPGMDVKRGEETISMSLTGGAADAAELRRYWEQLSGSGTVTMALEKQVWGDEFGMCVDGFGISWMVNIGQE